MCFYSKNEKKVLVCLGVCLQSLNNAIKEAVMMYFSPNVVTTLASRWRLIPQLACCHYIPVARQTLYLLSPLSPTQDKSPQLFSDPGCLTSSGLPSS